MAPPEGRRPPPPSEPLVGSVGQCPPQRDRNLSGSLSTALSLNTSLAGTSMHASGSEGRRGGRRGIAWNSSYCRSSFSGSWSLATSRQCSRVQSPEQPKRGTSIDALTENDTEDDTPFERPPADAGSGSAGSSSRSPHLSETDVPRPPVPMPPQERARPRRWLGSQKPQTPPEVTQGRTPSPDHEQQLCESISGWFENPLSAPGSPLRTSAAALLSSTTAPTVSSPSSSNGSHGACASPVAAATAAVVVAVVKACTDRALVCTLPVEVDLLYASSASFSISAPTESYSGSGIHPHTSLHTQTQSMRRSGRAKWATASFVLSDSDVSMLAMTRGLVAAPSADFYLSEGTPHATLTGSGSGETAHQTGGADTTDAEEALSSMSAANTKAVDAPKQDTSDLKLSRDIVDAIFETDSTGAATTATPTSGHETLGIHTTLDSAAPLGVLLSRASASNPSTPFPPVPPSVGSAGGFPRMSVSMSKNPLLSTIKTSTTELYSQVDLCLGSEPPRRVVAPCGRTLFSTAELCTATTTSSPRAPSSLCASSRVTDVGAHVLRPNRRMNSGRLIRTSAQSTPQTEKASLPCLDFLFLYDETCADAPASEGNASSSTSTPEVPQGTTCLSFETPTLGGESLRVGWSAFDDRDTTDDGSMVARVDAIPMLDTL
eukprot:TRINITY_DN10351_c0_g1_i1.p1 TRINITY_DN10351_c0_g1~~TRINITY_DN10351_c0_g1_i1.p1  ORF type:complete len:661 (+),score=128.92 TRINITY_DN10351_c0_g1_i1:95-2077(+)